MGPIEAPWQEDKAQNSTLKQGWVYQTPPRSPSLTLGECLRAQVPTLKGDGWSPSNSLVIQNKSSSLLWKSLLCDLAPAHFSHLICCHSPL